MKGSLPSNSTDDVRGFKRQLYGIICTPAAAASCSNGPEQDRDNNQIN